MTPPTVTSFGIPTTSGSLTVPINSFTATDDVAVTGYRSRNPLQPPAPLRPVGVGLPHRPTPFPLKEQRRFMPGRKMRLAMSRLASMQRSLSRFRLSPTRPSNCSDFSVPGTADSLTIPINKFTATDNTEVTGYKLTESATPPNASASGWSTSAPSTYAFVSEGPKTLYAWAKDAAGNVSSSLSATVTLPFHPPHPLTIWKSG